MSLSARRAWIEMTQFVPITTSDVSLSARRAWIEIAVQTVPSRVSTVALRKESVDRNEEYKEDPAGHGVALRKESVDRNLDCFLHLAAQRPVALRKESVDRNSDHAFRLQNP